MAERNGEEPTPQIETKVGMGYIARAAVLIIGLWALANMLWLGRDVLFVAFSGALLAAFLSVFVDPLHRHLKIPRVLAVLAVMLTLIAALAGLVWLAYPSLQEQVPLIRRELPEAFDRIRDWIGTRYQQLTGEFGEPDIELEDTLRQRLLEEGGAIVGGALPLLTTFAGAIAGVLIVIFAGIYLAVEPRLYADGLARLVPPRGRARMRHALHEVGRSLRMWMVGTLINMVLIGTLTTIGLMLIGVPAALALGLLAALLEFIPTIGPVLASIPAIAIALTVSPTVGLLTIGLYLVAQQIESNLSTPIVMKKAVKLPPALTLLFQTLMAVLFGFLGLLLAVPILAATLVFVRELYVRPLEGEKPELEVTA
jgi:predicted PurR-regulated permease PerM